MKVVVTSTGAGLDEPSSPTFGRCPMFVFVDTDSMEFEAVANPAVGASSGAGIEAAQLVTGSGASAVITGRVGPKAMNVLQTTGMPVYLFGGGTVRQAVESLVAGSLEPATGASGQGGRRSKGSSRHERGRTAKAAQRGKEETELRIAFSTEDERGLGSMVSHHFGRCPYYVLVDMKGSEPGGVIAVENPFYGNHQPGQVPRFIRSQGADVIITGGMGRRALGFFQEEDIEPVTGARGTVSEALNDYLGGRLSGAAPCRDSSRHAHDHHHHHHEPLEESALGEEDEVGRLRKKVETLERQLKEALGRSDRP
jgi:predicted Fe-Mo cluster-binding NifX family protein